MTNISEHHQRSILKRKLNRVVEDVKTLDHAHRELSDNVDKLISKVDIGRPPHCLEGRVNSLEKNVQGHERKLAIFDLGSREIESLQRVVPGRAGPHEKNVGSGPFRKQLDDLPNAVSHLTFKLGELTGTVHNLRDKLNNHIDSPCRHPDTLDWTEKIEQLQAEVTMLIEKQMALALDVPERLGDLDKRLKLIEATHPAPGAYARDVGIHIHRDMLDRLPIAVDQLESTVKRLEASESPRLDMFDVAIEQLRREMKDMLDRRATGWSAYAADESETPAEKRNAGPNLLSPGAEFWVTRNGETAIDVVTLWDADGPEPVKDGRKNWGAYATGPIMQLCAEPIMQLCAEEFELYTNVAIPQGAKRRVRLHAEVLPNE